MLQIRQELQAVLKQEESETNSFTDINYNNAIFDVTRASLTAPLKAKIWSNVNPGSTDYRWNPPISIFYDFHFKTTHTAENSSWDG